METIIVAQRHLCGRGSAGKEAYLVWNTSLKTALATPGFLQEHAPALVSLLLDTLPDSSSVRSTQRAVNRLVRAALAQPDGEGDAFLKALAAALLKQSAVSTSLAPQTAFTLLQWSCLLLEALPAEGGSKATAKLLEAQANLLNVLYADGPDSCHWQAASRAVLRLLRARPRLLADYAAAAAATGSAGMVRAMAAAAVQRRSQTQQQEQQEQRQVVAAALLPVLCDQVLAGRAKPPPHLLAAYGPLLSDLNASELIDKLLPAANKAMRRTPEPAIAALADMLQHVRLDMSGPAPELLTLLLQQLRAKEAVRPSAEAALSALAARVQDAGVGAALVQQLSSLLGGCSAEGKVKVASERGALAAALTALASLPAGAAGKASSGAATFCSTYYKDEPVEDVKLALLSCLTAWLPKCSAGAPPAVVQQLAAGLAEPKEGLRRGNLRAALAAVKAQPGLAAAMGPLAAPLAKLVSEGCAKAVARADGVAALLLAAQVAAADSAADAVLDKAGVWSGPVSADSPLLSPATLAKLAPGEAAAVPLLAQSLLLQHGKRLKGGAREAVCRLLPLCLLHHSPEVRRPAAAAAKATLSASPGLMGALLAGLRHWANNTREALVLVDTAAGEAVSPAVGSYSHTFAAALHALLPPAAAATTQQEQQPEQQQQQNGHVSSSAQQSEALAGGGLSQLLLMGHHPAITVGVSKKLGAWQAACNRLTGIPAELKEHASDVISDLLGPSGLGSSNAGDVSAAQLALGSLMAAAPLACLDPLLTGLGSWLERSAHDGLTQDDFTVYATPEGLLSSEVVPEGVYVPEVVVSKNVRKARGRFKTDNRAFATADDESDDGPAAPPPRASGAAAAGGRGGGRGGPAAAAAAAGGGGGKGPKDAATRQAEFRAKKLQEEAEVRARVASIKARLDTGLAALNAAVEGNTAFAAAYLRELSGLCQPLMASPVSGDAAFAAVRSLARCMPPPLGQRSLLLAGSLRLVGLAARGTQGVSYDSIPERSAVAEVVGALHASTVPARAPLPGPSYALVFPVVAAVLRCPVLSPLHDAALGVLALHVSPEQDIPRGETLELLYHLLGLIPAYRDRVQPLLRSLCAGVSDPELPAAVSGLLSGSAAVRATALAALPHVPTLAEGVPPESPGVTAVLALARHDVNEDNAAAAEALWEQAGCELGSDLIPLLVQHLTSQQPDTRAAAASALAHAVDTHPSTTSDSLAAVVALYGEHLEEDMDEARAAVLLDDAERAARDAARQQQAATRAGVAAALEALSGVLTPGPDVNTALDFLVSRGLAEPDDRVREAMVGAGVALVEAHGEALAQQLLPQFESYLDRGAAGRLGLSESRYDLVREGVVVLLGMMAGHLAAGDDKRRSIIYMLLDVLSTPSEAVQRAVSNCLPRLVQPLAGDREFVQGLLDRLLAEVKSGGPGGYGVRRGAAYGVSGVVKGLGIASLKGFGVLEALKSMVEDKKDAAGREGALQAFECLCEKLGRLFEPYVIHILPLLLQCFGDASPQVRAAAEDAARSIMGQLSASGVKLVLPALLKGLEDSAWRTKQGSIQLLGAMAHCAPKQLGSCLPTIVPRLGGVLGDPHPKVQAAAKEALQEVGSVIRSPEMSALVPALLAAIADPNTATRDCLDTLLSTTFVNTIDAPSLALVVPVVHRGLRDRTGDTKKRAARIAGTMCSLTNDPKDMAPYVPLLMPELQKALLDPLPEVRATAARAMGSLLKGMGPAALGDLLPWLLTTLRSEGSSVERSGAAQGLAEVLAVMGAAHLSELLPELAASATSKNPFVREGHLTLFRYLPLTMEAEFQDHLGEVLPLILDGLSDEAEGVRDAALSAGRCFVEAYARSCMSLLLPAVERGMSGDNWRIRQSSLELCGDMLFKVAGTSGKVKLDGGSDDEGAACESYGTQILAALGPERYATVLSKLYLARSDVQYVVRNTALHIWKTIVVNTPRTLQEVLPSLMAEVISALADPSEDRRAGAARCLGELVRKMGERVLHRMLPILRETMGSPDAATRQGVCTGLMELLENVTRHQLTEHLADILPPIQGALCDPDPSVREAAGSAFGVLFKGGAHGAVESVVPSLLHGLDSPQHATQSLEGLRVILGVRPQVFHGIVPKLLKAPVSSAGLRALGQLAGTAAPVLPSHLSAIMNTCLALASGHTPAAGHKAHTAAAAAADSDEQQHDPREEAAAEAALAVALAVDEDSLPSLVSELLGALEDVGGRALGACRLISAYARGTRHDLEDHADELLTALVLLLAEDGDELVLAAWKGCEAVAATIPKENQSRHVGALKDALAGAKEKERRKRRGGPLHLKGLTLPPKALGPFVPIYLQGVLQGLSPEVREVSAEGLGELVGLTSEEGLKPFVVTITGPLIRIIGDRFPPATKAAILVTLGQLIRRAGAGLKPFVPQLQTTFVKCLNDQSSAVRMTAADNLGQLTRLSARVEVLVADLANSAATAAEPDTAAAYLTALSGALGASGDRLTPPTLEKVQASLLGLYRSTGSRPSSTSGTVDPAAAALAIALARYASVAGPAGLSAVLEAGPLGPKALGGSQQERELAAMMLAAVAGAAAAQLEGAGLLKPVVEAAVKATRDAELTSVRVAGGRAVCRLAAEHRNLGPALNTAMTTLLGPDQGSEVQRQAMLSLARLAAVDDGSALSPHLPALLPSVCSILQREPNSQVRAAAEALLKKGLRLELGLETGQAAAASAGGTTKAFLTDAYLRRLAARQGDDWEEVEEY